MLIELTLVGGGAALWRYIKAAPRESGDKGKSPKRVRTRAEASPTASPRTPRFSVVRLVRDIKSALVAEGRQNLRVDLDPRERERLSRVQKSAVKSMTISGGAIGLVLLGNAMPPFRLLGAGAVMYLSRDNFIIMRTDFRRGHYLSTYMLNVAMLLGMIVTGQLLLAAIGGFLTGLFAKLTNRLENESEQALVGAFGGHPEKVWIIQNGVERQVDFKTIGQGDLVVVNAGEVIPVDGNIEEGRGQIDQHLISGEREPMDKEKGDAVLAASLLISGRLCVRVEATGNDTMAAKVGQVLEQTQGYKDNLTLRARVIADQYVPLSIVLSLTAYPLFGAQGALTALAANFGGSMAGMGPLSVLNYLQLLSRHGILVKDGRIFESLPQVDTVLFDRKIALDPSRLILTRIRASTGYSEEDVLGLAAAVQQGRPDAGARAIVAAAGERGVEPPVPDEPVHEVDNGLAARIGGRRVCVGGASMLRDMGIEPGVEAGAMARRAETHEPMSTYVAIDDALAGTLEMQPAPNGEIAAVTRFLQSRNIDVIMTSEAPESPTRHLAEALGIERHYADTPSERKADKVKQLRDDGRFVCVIGDGIHDAVALKSAQVSMSLMGASSAATDTAQIVFMDGTFRHLEQLFDYVDQFEQTHRLNLLASFAPAGAILGGLVLFHMGLAGAMVINYIGGFASLGNTLWPLVKNQDHGDEHLRPEAGTTDAVGYPPEQPASSPKT